MVLTISPQTVCLHFYNAPFHQSAVNFIHFLVRFLASLFSFQRPRTAGGRGGSSRGVSKPKQTDRFSLLIESICLWISTNERAIRARTH